VRRGDTTSTHLRKPSIAHVVWNGFILGELLSLQMRIMGICEKAREVSALDLGSLRERQTDPRLLDERVHRTNATAVTARHAVDLVEDEARLVRDGHAGCRRRLRRRARRVVSSGLESSAVKHTHAGALHPAVDALVVDVGASLRGHGARGGQRSDRSHAISLGGRCTSMSFLLRASLALSSSGSYPHSLATRWAVVVLPMPGGPESRTALCVPIAFLPGRLKPVLRLASLA
jgi:hypothetical protein